MIKCNCLTLKGMHIEDAIRFIKESGCKYRIIREDKEDYPITLDYHTDRFNLEVENSMVVKVQRG